jgi:Sec-independent protein translocase protein TatA
MEAGRWLKMLREMMQNKEDAIPQDKRQEDESKEKPVDPE